MKKKLLFLVTAAACAATTACGSTAASISPSLPEAVPVRAESTYIPTAYAAAATQSAAVEITDENYQTLFHLAPEYKNIGIAYYKAPRDMFGRDAFIDAYLPYGGQLEYSEDGLTVVAKAHGMQVSNTMAYNDKNAKDVVDQAYTALVNSGLDIYEESVSDTVYNEGYDIAIKQFFYYEENRTKPRVAVLYADTRQNGYYLSARITYYPEQFDESQSALLKELCDVFAVNLPDIPAIK